MKISEYIAALSAIRDEHGDLDVESYNVHFDRVPARDPKIAYRKVLRGRESKPSYADPAYDKPERIGDKVCQV